MQVEFHHRPAATAARIILQPQESFTAEAGAMIAMNDHIHIETTTLRRNSGSVMMALKRMVAGESFFLNHYTASSAGGEVWLGAVLPGDMDLYELSSGMGLILQAGAFVACESGVSLDCNWQGFRTLFSGESLFWLRASGSGKIVFNSYGAIYAVDVDGEYIVDTGHIVAFEESLQFHISKAGSSWLHSFLGGEGLVCKFQGRGRVWCQSHCFEEMAKNIGPSLKPL